MNIIKDNITNTFRETIFDNDISRKEYFNETGESFMIEWFNGKEQLSGCLLKLEREFYQIRQINKLQ